MTTNYERDTMFSPYWDAAPTSPSIPEILEEMWADFSDFAEATWTDEADADEQEDPWPQGDIFAA